MDINKIIQGLERAKQIIGTQNEQGGSYSDCFETIAIEEAIKSLEKQSVMSKANEKLNEAINFFESGDGFDKKELIADWVDEIKEIKGNPVDEIGLEWDGKTIMTLDDFASRFYDKIISGICNVLKSFKTE